MECVKNPNYNCAKNKEKYVGDHECCMQNGNEGRFGILVLKGQCDKKRGLPVKGCKDPNNKFVPKELYENFVVNSREGFKDDDDCNCSNWNKAFMVLFIIIMLLVFLGALWYMQNAKIR